MNDYVCKNLFVFNADSSSFGYFEDLFGKGVIEQVEAENGRVAFITSAMSEAEANAKINEAAASYSLVTRIRVL